MYLNDPVLVTFKVLAEAAFQELDPRRGEVAPEAGERPGRGA